MKRELKNETIKLPYFTNTKYKNTLLSQSSIVHKFAVLPILEKQSALYENGQKNMPTKMIIKKNKAPFMNTC